MRKWWRWRLGRRRRRHKSTAHGRRDNLGREREGKRGRSASKDVKWNNATAGNAHAASSGDSTRGGIHGRIPGLLNVLGSGVRLREQLTAVVRANNHATKTWPSSGDGGRREAYRPPFIIALFQDGHGETFVICAA